MLHIYQTFAVIQALLIVSKIIIQFIVVGQGKITFSDILFGKYFGFDIMLPVRTADIKLKLASKIANILLVAFYLNFIVFYFLAKNTLL